MVLHILLSTRANVVVPIRDKPSNDGVLLGQFHPHEIADLLPDEEIDGFLALTQGDGYVSIGDEETYWNEIEHNDNADLIAPSCLTGVWRSHGEVSREHSRDTTVLPITGLMGFHAHDELVISQTDCTGYRIRLSLSSHRGKNLKVLNLEAGEMNFDSDVQDGNEVKSLYIITKISSNFRELSLLRLGPRKNQMSMERISIVSGGTQAHVTGFITLGKHKRKYTKILTRQKDYKIKPNVPVAISRFLLGWNDPVRDNMELFEFTSVFTLHAVELPSFEAQKTPLPNLQYAMKREMQALIEKMQVPRESTDMFYLIQVVFCSTKWIIGRTYLDLKYFDEFVRVQLFGETMETEGVTESMLSLCPPLPEDAGDIFAITEYLNFYTESKACGSPFVGYALLSFLNIPWNAEKISWIKRTLPESLQNTGYITTWTTTYPTEQPGLPDEMENDPILPSCFEEDDDGSVTTKSSYISPAGDHLAGDGLATRRKAAKPSHSLRTLFSSNPEYDSMDDDSFHDFLPLSMAPAHLRSQADDEEDIDEQTPWHKFSHRMAPISSDALAELRSFLGNYGLEAIKHGGKGTSRHRLFRSDGKSLVWQRVPAAPMTSILGGVRSPTTSLLGGVLSPTSLTRRSILLEEIIAVREGTAYEDDGIRGTPTLRNIPSGHVDLSKCVSLLLRHRSLDIQFLKKADYDAFLRIMLKIVPPQSAKSSSVSEVS